MAMWHNNPYGDGIWYYNIDRFDTREDAINDGVEQYKRAMNNKYDTDLFRDCDSNDIQTFFYIGQEDTWEPYIDTDYVLEQVEDDCSMECGDIAYDFFDHISTEEHDALDKKLQDIIKSWMDECGMSFYSIVNLEKIDVNDYL